MFAIFSVTIQKIWFKKKLFASLLLFWIFQNYVTISFHLDFQHYRIDISLA